MKEKILNKIHEKLCSAFKIKFLPLGQFEKEFSGISNELLNEIISLTKTYEKLKNSTTKSKSSQIINVTKDEYIIEQFNLAKRRNSYSSYGKSDTKYTIDNLEELKSNQPNDYEDYSTHYDKLIENDDENIVKVSLGEFITVKTSEYFSGENNPNEVPFIKRIFWQFFHSTYLIKDNYYNRYNRYKIKEIVDSPEKVVESFKEDYLTNKYLKLLDIADKNISDETLSGFETFIINVGNLSFERERSGWSTITFQVINNGKTYSFSHSAKDEKEIKGEYINIFIFQKNHLIKISITLDQVERTPYIIHRDCEKISLKNECEIVIVKHHGNETIIFDTRKEALEFQAKLIEIREGRRPPFDRK